MFQPRMRVNYTEKKQKNKKENLRIVRRNKQKAILFTCT